MYTPPEFRGPLFLPSGGLMLVSVYGTFIGVEHEHDFSQSSFLHR